MSTYFSKVIKAGDRLREFNFKLASPNDDSRYIVDVPDDKGQRLMFSVYRNANGEWKVSSQLIPMWLYDSETAFSEAIEENRQQELSRKK
jgi:hypothetical protein